MARLGALIHRTAPAREPLSLEWASREQELAFLYGPYPLCLSGGFGAAKTYTAMLKALYLSDMYPGNRGLIARRLWTDLQKTTMATFFKLCPADAWLHGGRRSDQDKILRLNNGSEILWAHMDDPEVENLIKGLEINWFVLDQAEEIEEDIFVRLLSRLGRWDQAKVPSALVRDYESTRGQSWPHFAQDGAPIPPTYAMLTCNPDAEFHWIYRRFHPESTDWQRQFKSQGYRMIHMSSLSNRFLTEQNRRQLLSSDESFVRRYVEGKWGIPEGQIHRVPPESIINLRDEQHAVDMLDWLRTTCWLGRTLDHGDSSPTCCLWWAVDQAGNVFCYREYYMPDKLISEHRANISALSRDEHYRANLADPAIFIKVMQKHGGRWSVDDEYRDVRAMPADTALFFLPADNNELGTRNRINEYLRVDPDRVHPITKKPGAPRLYFVRRSDFYPHGCDYTIREMQGQRRVKAGTALGRPIFSDERDGRLPDHSYDCVRYFIASRPPVAPSTSRRISSRSFVLVRKAALQFQRDRGRERPAIEARQMSRRQAAARARFQLWRRTGRWR